MVLPDGYRNWVHVKSALVAPGAREKVGAVGGFRHILNAEAMTGYRTRTFPEGSVVVFDWLLRKCATTAHTRRPRGVRST